MIACVEQGRLAESAGARIAREWQMSRLPVTAGRNAMDIEDLEPRKKAVPPKNLDALSIGELQEYIAELQAEIDRTRAKIAAKESHRLGAAALFKSG